MPSMMPGRGSGNSAVRALSMRVGGRPNYGGVPGGSVPVGTESGGGGGGGDYTAPQLNINVERNPQLQAMYDEYGKYRSGLAAGNDQDAINAMQRQRDLNSGSMKELQAMAGSRGNAPGTGASNLLVSRQLQSSGRNLGGLNAGLASDARRQQLAALGGQTNAASAGAAADQGQQNFALNAWQAQQSALQAAAQLRAMQQQQGFQQNMQLAQLFTGM